jgi:hypothetical protein
LGVLQSVGRTRRPEGASAQLVSRSDSEERWDMASAEGAWSLRGLWLCNSNEGVVVGLLLCDGLRSVPERLVLLARHPEPVE